jgi:hydrogenase nickel incorporation protein HypA/HybF
MHELPLAEAILEVALQAAAGHPVRQVRVRAGALQRSVQDSLQFCFELAAAGTPAAEARLDVTIQPAHLRCRRCQAESDLLTPPFLCGACGDPDVEYVSGDELLVDGVELDTGWRFRPGADHSAVVAANIPAGHLEEHAQAERVAPTERVTFARGGRTGRRAAHGDHDHIDHQYHRESV